jgi:hypothetical protein
VMWAHLEEVCVICSRSVYRVTIPSPVSFRKYWNLLKDKFKETGRYW